jgi:5-methylcytosine-specific restriction endonuclease McrA
MPAVQTTSDFLANGGSVSYFAEQTGEPRNFRLKKHLWAKPVPRKVTMKRPREKFTCPPKPKDYDKSFLLSAEWAAMKIDLISIYGSKCQLCGREYHLARYLQIHHLCYDRYGGDETPEDLICLCGRCHMKEHGLKPPKMKKPKKKRKRAVNGS